MFLLFQEETGHFGFFGKIKARGSAKFCSGTNLWIPTSYSFNGTLGDVECSMEVPISLLMKTREALLLNK